MKNRKLKKVLTLIAGFMGVGVLAYTGHHFGLYDLTPVMNTLGVRVAEFGWATAGYTGLFIISKVTAGVASDILANRNEQLAYQTQLKIDSERVTQEKLDRNYQVQSENQILMKTIIEADIESKEYIANLSIVKDTPIAEMAHSLKEKYKARSLEIGRDAVDDTLDAGSKLLDKVVDKGTDFLINKIDQVL